GPAKNPEAVHPAADRREGGGHHRHRDGLHQSDAARIAAGRNRARTQRRRRAARHPSAAHHQPQVARTELVARRYFSLRNFYIFSASAAHHSRTISSIKLQLIFSSFETFPPVRTLYKNEGERHVEDHAHEFF